MTFEDFIKNHIRVAPEGKNYIRVAPEGKNIELTPAQYAFLDWLEECKKKGLKPLKLKGRDRI